ncbi:hypothetical protein [Bacillus thuringiensis]|uniref:hypothetical protein n=1 Tax=Bacillus thuringiensis TaxID=1428 RepID=UPI000B434798|nr:hypothetical protein [Bacillus thuringiensis]MED3184021.1 hypothetical protein [Bacillus thuringiensis]OTY13606.1 hypothetical protein BK734_09045 [Bacillus thuringiensis serovar kim]OUB20648.1 hypothetical protein BK733_07105 [Bacillus thuringiensis serovar xiaguangiensis]HEF1901528.1 hypothetical protein [Bacillus cereus]
MQLTELEKAIALSTILNTIDEDKLEDYVELESLRPIVKVLNRLNKRTKPEEKKEAITDLISNLMDDLLNSKE